MPDRGHRLLLLSLLTGCALSGPVFATDAAPLVPPAWRERQARWEWREIAASSLSLGPPSTVVGMESSASARIDAWAGLAVDERSGDVYLAASGG